MSAFYDRESVLLVQDLIRLFDVLSLRAVSLAFIQSTSQLKHLLFSCFSLSGSDLLALLDD